MKDPKVCVLRTAGTNCDKESAFAFKKAGAEPELVHINSLICRMKGLHDYQILVFPGGFSYGDDLGAGKILANELKYKLKEELVKFIGAGKLIIGICNGFQVLVKSGLLPGDGNFEQSATLMLNDTGKFEDRWVYLKTQDSRLKTPALPAGRHNACVWTKDLPKVIYLPVAHGEGKFITKDKSVLEKLRKNNQIVFQYCDEKGEFSGYPHNPNGSIDNIAGICDETGRILGLMPHPERHIEFSAHPRWTGAKQKMAGDGLGIFKNGVEYARRNI